MRPRDEPIRGRGFESGLAVQFPKHEPAPEVSLFQPERQVRRPETAPVTRRAAGLQGPEVRDLLQVCRPIVDLGVEDGADQGILPHIGIEVAEERPDSADSFGEDIGVDVNTQAE